MNIGSFFKALVSVAESDAKSVLPTLASAASSVASNQSPATLAAAGASVLAAGIKLGPQVEADEIQTLADIVSDYATKAASSTGTTVTPASAAAAAVAG